MRHADLVDGLGVPGVVPVVELRRDDYLAQPRFWQGGGETYHSGLRYLDKSRIAQLTDEQLPGCAQAGQSKKGGGD
jgi:hypothetical protein